MQSIFLHIHWECSIQWSQHIRAVVLKWLNAIPIFFFTWDHCNHICCATRFTLHDNYICFDMALNIKCMK